MIGWRSSKALIAACAITAAACDDNGGANDASVDMSVPMDAATDAAMDASIDAAMDAATDASELLDGAVDASLTRLPIDLPTGLANWTFYGPESGGPNQVFGASFDEGGNLWVAGGEEGLFVMRAGAARFDRYTMTDGLRPYGFMADGTDPPGPKYLKVISVSGAWAGTAFVGYQGLPPGAGELDCESNWDGPKPNPAIYKSGDADKVTLGASGISVVHYDISSGPGLVGAELRGREKVCNILRIRYDASNQRVWFGGNHGFAMGYVDYAGTAACQWLSTPVAPVPTDKTSPFTNEYGHAGCNGLVEHVHPAIDTYFKDGSCCAFSTGDYYGLALDPKTHDVWFGGALRATRFRYASSGGDYYAAESQTEDRPYISNRIDVWPDAVGEPNIPHANERTDDLISGAAAMSDGSVWFSSFDLGLAHVDGSGQVIERLKSGDGLPSNHLSALVTDPLDESVWMGTNYGPGLGRMHGGTITPIDGTVLGDGLSWDGVSDIQAAGHGGSRKIIVSFRGDGMHAGAVGIYSGP